jgi:hypothetical protein
VLDEGDGDMTEPTKCRVEDGLLTPCWVLDELIDDDRKRGIVFRQFRNLETLKPTRSCAVIRSGDKHKNGVIANYCPFCGESIADHMKAVDA